MISRPLITRPPWTKSTCCIRKKPPSIHSKVMCPSISGPDTFHVPTNLSRLLRSGFGLGVGCEAWELLVSAILVHPYRRLPVVLVEGQRHERFVARHTFEAIGVDQPLGRQIRGTRLRRRSPCRRVRARRSARRRPGGGRCHRRPASWRSGHTSTPRARSWCRPRRPAGTAQRRRA
jgi:hypothetical protein